MPGPFVEVTYVLQAILKFLHHRDIIQSRIWKVNKFGFGTDMSFRRRLFTKRVSIKNSSWFLSMMEQNFVALLITNFTSKQDLVLLINHV
ncbi:hypothetical protein NY2A_b836R [Paramecium bursaria Chlorella virus NY2A]|uniref:Uncharacterized protein b836R n=1 Tax=Paramecium bursaria Chlorella virus NY2A TaxID=46021 RepID=A7IY11_PBCVN|nr:hypothetical protein NY2A_b836R [Paramecium bursaria Chlorella virus NY2A]ABT15235.1 hypothetical protein NY2A_b836R [Paramecium bursaria Chlorella virus NY2A]